MKKSDKELYDMSNISYEYAMKKTKEFYDEVEKNKNNINRVKHIPINELEIYSIVKELNKKFDNEE